MPREISRSDTPPPGNPLGQIADDLIKAMEAHALAHGDERLIICLSRPDPALPADRLRGLAAHAGYDDSLIVLGDLLEHAEAIARTMGATVILQTEPRGRG